MKDISKFAVIFVILVLFGGLIFYFSKRSAEPSLKLAEKNLMRLISPAFEEKQSIPQKYTCDGQDINPPLKIEDVPTGTKSLVLVVDDPDAPRGTWVHWTVWNIAPDTKEIPENSVPQEAVEGITDFGTTGYGGPCPPSGTHRYFFRLYALSKTLQLNPSATKTELEKAMKGFMLEQTELMGVYGRP